MAFSVRGGVRAQHRTGQTENVFSNLALPILVVISRNVEGFQILHFHVGTVQKLEVAPSLIRQ